MKKTNTTGMTMTGWTTYASLRPRGYAHLVSVTTLVQGTGLSIASTDALPTTADVEYAPTWSPPL